MSRYGFEPYVSVAQKKEEARKNYEILKKKSPNINPVHIQGTQIARTWWSKAWNRNLESYAALSNRISRGRSYLKNGAVLDLQIESGHVSAIVLGSGRSNYNIQIEIDPLNPKRYEAISILCNRKIDSLEELIEGKFPKELEELFTTQNEGIFPSPKEIHFACSCPDYALVCKHIAAVLYGIGARLDDDPLLFFKLRGIDVEVLIKKSIEEKMNSLLKNADTKSDRTIQDSEVFDLFGI